MPRQRRIIDYKSYHTSGSKGEAASLQPQAVCDPRGAGCSSNNSADNMARAEAPSTSFYDKMVNLVSPASWRRKANPTPTDIPHSSGSQDSTKQNSIRAVQRLEDSGSKSAEQSELNYEPSEGQGSVGAAEILEFADRYSDDEFLESSEFVAPEEDDPQLAALRARLQQAKVSRDRQRAQQRKDAERARVEAELAAVEKELKQLRQGRGKSRPADGRPRPGPDQIRRRQIVREVTAPASARHHTVVDVDYTSDSDPGEEFSHSVQAQKRSLKSGIFDKSVNHISNKQQWPHLWLRDEYPGKNLTFMDLDFKLFVAGELEIISSESVPHIERQARTHLLKTLTYMHRSCEWEFIRDIYIAMMNELETGHLRWDQYDTLFQSKVQWLVTKLMVDKSHKPKKASKGKQPNADVFFCRRYNAGNCAESKDHPGTARDGRKIMWRHICGTCFVKRKEQNVHREFTADCPLHSAPSGHESRMN